MYYLIWNAIVYQLWDKHKKLMKMTSFFQKHRLQKLTAVIVFQIKNIGGEILHNVAWLTEKMQK